MLLVLLCFGQKVYNEKNKKITEDEKNKLQKKVFAIFEQHEQHKLIPWKSSRFSRAPLNSQEQHKSNTEQPIARLEVTSNVARHQGPIRRRAKVSPSSLDMRTMIGGWYYRVGLRLAPIVGGWVKFVRGLAGGSTVALQLSNAKTHDAVVYSCSVLA